MPADLNALAATLTQARAAADSALAALKTTQAAWDAAAAQWGVRTSGTAGRHSLHSRSAVDAYADIQTDATKLPDANAALTAHRTNVLAWIAARDAHAAAQAAYNAAAPSP